MRINVSTAAILFIAALLCMYACSSENDGPSGPGDGVGDYDLNIPDGDSESLFEDGDSSSPDGDSDGDGEETQTPQQQVESVATEMLAGRMARSAEALEQRVFPHLSADYQRAGLDRAGQMQYELRELGENPGLEVVAYLGDVKVEVEENEAVVDIACEISATLTDPQGRVFALSVSGTYEERAWFVFEDDAFWRCIGSVGVSSDVLTSGGDGAAAADLSDFAVDAHEVSAAGTLSFGGSFDVPQLAEGRSMRAVLSLDFGDRRANAFEWTSDADTLWSADISDKSGSRFDFEVSLPDDGSPRNIEIPATLEPGEDAISASLSLFTFDGGDFELLHIDRRSIAVSLKNAGHGAFCESGKGDTPDGLWKMRLSNDTAPDLNLYQLADLRIVEGDVYGHVLYVSHTQQDEYIPMALEVAGTLDGDELSFAFEGEDFSVEYAGSIKNGVISDGQAVFEVSLTSIMADFSAEKLDTRCSSLLPGDMNGEKVSLALDKKIMSFDISSENYNVVLAEENTGRNLAGYLIRNLLAVVDDTTPGSWLLLGFYDETGGFAAHNDGGEIVEGSFAVETELPTN